MKQTSDKSITWIYKSMFLQDNDRETITPGNLMQLMEEIAFMIATTKTRAAVTMISTDNISIAGAIRCGCTIELTGHVMHVENNILHIKVDAYAGYITDESRPVGEGTFRYTFNKVPLDSIVINTPLAPKSKQMFVGGEKELRAMLNERLFPKTIARATLYNYVKTLKIQKALYSHSDVELLIDYIKDLQHNRLKN